MKFIFIFLNNKLITCDTILPFVVDLKKYNPDLKVKFITFNLATLNVIYKNTNLINIINEYGTINVLGWLKTDYGKILRILCKVIHILKIILYSIIFKSKNIHFKGLEHFPFNLIYLINKNNTYLFEGNCWGHSLNVFKADDIFYENKKRGIEEKEFKSYKYLVSFSQDWPQIKFCGRKKKFNYLIPSTRLSKNWLNTCKKHAEFILTSKPKWMNEKFKNKKKILYVLGSLGKFPTIDKSCTGESLLYDTLDLILQNTDCIILLKPHAITDIARLNLIINKFNTNRVFITYNHIAVISYYCDYALANYFSYALTDAWVNGIKTIEYTKYDKEVLIISNGESLEPKYIDSFINDNPQELIKELRNPYKKFIRKNSTKLHQDYRKLIETISK